VAAPDGSDAAAGTEGAPYRTVQKLVDSLARGGLGCLRGGTYTARPYVMNAGAGGFTIESYPGERAKLAGIVQIRAGADDLTLADVTVEGDGSQNTIQDYSTGFRLEGSEITNDRRGLSCLLLGSEAAGRAVRPRISRNVFHDCGSPADGNKDHGIYASDVRGAEIVGNVFYDQAAYAIQLYPNAQGSLVAHNVIDGGPPSIRGGIAFGSEGPVAAGDNIVERNVIAYARTTNLTATWGGEVGSGNVARDNCLWAAAEANTELSGVAESGNLVADPDFADRAAHDYTLSPGSPCAELVGD
jgi:hypothetical protein